MRRQRAQGIAEYGLIILFIVFVAAIALVFFGNQLAKLIQGLGGGLNACPTVAAGKSSGVAGCP
jgi:hypothetical protein